MNHRVPSARLHPDSNIFPFLKSALGISLQPSAALQLQLTVFFKALIITQKATHGEASSPLMLTWPISIFTIFIHIVQKAAISTRHKVTQVQRDSLNPCCHQQKQETSSTHSFIPNCNRCLFTILHFLQCRGCFYSALHLSEPSSGLTANTSRRVLHEPFIILSAADTNSKPRPKTCTCCLLASCSAQTLAGTNHNLTSISGYMRR